MKKLLFAILILFSIHCPAQQDSVLNEFYYGRSKGFYELVGKKINFPSPFNVGVSILSWSVYQGKLQNIYIINPITRQIQNDLIRTIDYTEGNWVNRDTLIEFFMPIKFSYSSFNYHTESYPETYLSEIQVTAIKSGFFPSDKTLLSNMNSYMKAKKYKSALKVTQKLLQRNPLSLELLETKTYCYKRLGQYQKACEVIEFTKVFLNEVSNYSCEYSNRKE